MNKFKFLASKVMEIALAVMVHQVTLLMCSVSAIGGLIVFSGAANLSQLPPMLTFPGTLAAMAAITSFCLTVLSGIVYAAALLVKAASKI